MASLIVHVLRAPAGIHPASAVALCVARDLATQRGAAVTALAMGDAGDRDHEVTAMCGRYGADQLLFVGPEDLERLKERVAPRRVFVPNTPEGKTFLANLGIDDSETSALLVERPMTVEALGDSTGLLLHAGTLPWHNLEDVIDPDYGENFARIQTVRAPEARRAMTKDPTLGLAARSVGNHDKNIGTAMIVSNRLAYVNNTAGLCDRHLPQFVDIRDDFATVLQLEDSFRGLSALDGSSTKGL